MTTRAEANEPYVKLGYIPPGIYWAVVTSDEVWPKLPPNTKSLKNETQPSTGESYRILQVTANVPLNLWPYNRWGAAESTLNPYAEGIFAPEGSTPREKFIEAGEEILDAAEEAKKVASKVGDSLKWIVGAGIFVGVLFLFSKLPQRR